MRVWNSLSAIGLPGICVLLAACSSGGGEAGDGMARPAGAKVGGMTMMEEKFAGGFDYKTDDDGNTQIVSTKGDFLETNGFTQSFDEANLMSTGNAQRYQDAEYWGTRDSAYGNQESRFAQEMASEGDQNSRWGDRRFAGSDDSSRYGDQNYATDDYADGDRVIHGNSHSNFEGQIAGQNNQRYARGEESAETPTVPDIIRTLGQGGFVSDEQVNALTH